MLQFLGRTWKRIPRHGLVILIDTCLVVLSLPLALLLRDVLERPGFTLGDIAPLALVTLFVFVLTGSYRKVWRYVAVDDFVEIFRNALLIVALFCAAQFLVDRLASIPRTVPLLQIGLSPASWGRPASPTRFGCGAGRRRPGSTCSSSAAATTRRFSTTCFGRRGGGWSRSSASSTTGWPGGG
ncbi:MAG: hypothetical protein KDG89_01445 [Geminicoccaceae bacterium]|nr:hypothetical protein [Geminicoccaceae bacterium]